MKFLPEFISLCEIDFSQNLIGREGYSLLFPSKTPLSLYRGQEWGLDLKPNLFLAFTAQSEK